MVTVPKMLGCQSEAPIRDLRFRCSLLRPAPAQISRPPVVLVLFVAVLPLQDSLLQSEGQN